MGSQLNHSNSEIKQYERKLVDSENSKNLLSEKLSNLSEEQSMQNKNLDYIKTEMSDKVSKLCSQLHEARNKLREEEEKVFSMKSDLISLSEDERKKSKLLKDVVLKI